MSIRTIALVLLTPWACATFNSSSERAEETRAAEETEQQTAEDGNGTLAREAIAKVARDNIAAIQGCYERELLKNPSAEGQVVLEWVVDTDGTVRDVKQVSSELPKSATQCMMDKVTTWKFPPPAGGTVVIEYPFIFDAL